jgi:dsDNA-specific endonuclease/ATPase MutS2
MQPGVLRALEFDRIVEAVRGLSITPMGDEQLARLSPSSDPQVVAQLLAATTETARFIAKFGLFPLRGSSDLTEIAGGLAVEGRLLEAPRLLTLAAFLESVEQTKATIRSSPGSFPLLNQTCAAAASFKGEIAQVRDKIDPGGEVVDSARYSAFSLRAISTMRLAMSGRAMLVPRKYWLS